MDETAILATIGKFYLEVSRLQQLVENQQRRILELESQLTAFSKQETEIKKKNN